MKKKQNVTPQGMKRSITPDMVNKLKENPTATMERVFKKLGKKFAVTTPVNKLTANQFISLIKALSAALSDDE